MSLTRLPCDCCDGLFSLDRIGVYVATSSPPGVTIHQRLRFCFRCYERLNPAAFERYLASAEYRRRKEDAAEERRRVIADRRDADDDLDRRIADAVADALARQPVPLTPAGP